MSSMCWSDHCWERLSGWLLMNISTTVFFGKGNIVYAGREQNSTYTHHWACFPSQTISAGRYIFIVRQRSQIILLSKQFHSQKMWWCVGWFFKAPRHPYFPFPAGEYILIARVCVKSDNEKRNRKSTFRKLSYNHFTMKTLWSCQAH